MEHVSKRKTVKKNVARREGRPVTDYTWRNGDLYYADGVRNGGRQVSEVAKVSKPARPVTEAPRSTYSYRRY